MVNRNIWYPWYHITSYWGFFVVNDGAQIIYCHPQMMCYIVCHSNLVYVYVNYVSHGKNKGPMSYNKEHGASNLKKHISHEHVEEGKRWDLLVQKD
jgi:hypothetical protein